MYFDEEPITVFAKWYFSTSTQQQLGCNLYVWNISFESEEQRLINICIIKYNLITLCLKNLPPLTCYCVYIHGSITIIFGTNVTEKVGNQKFFIFPPHLSSSSALPGETGNPEIASFRLPVSAACFLPET